MLKFTSITQIYKVSLLSSKSHTTLKLIPSGSKFLPHISDTSFKFFSIFILSILLFSCATGPDYAPPQIEVPQQYSAEGQPAETVQVDAWWETFGDPVLIYCIEEALASNKDLEASFQRIRMARAMRRMESSRFWPDIDTNLSYTVDRLSENNPRFQDAIRIGLFPRDVEYWDTGFDVNWEIDVFGGTRRRVEGAVARIEEEAYQQQALRITVAAEVARNYIEIVGNQQKLMILEEKITNEEKRIQILEKKHRSGLIPENQIFKSQSRKQEFQSLIPKLQADIQAGHYRLAVLMGRRPEEVVTDINLNRPLPFSNGQVPVGLPSDLLLRRPDLLAAERKLAAATADIGAAKAEFFPRFYLTGSPRLESGDFIDLFNSASTAWLFGPKVTWRIFSGARNKAQLETARALREQTFIEYEIAVNKALEEVESNLTRYGKDAQSLRYVAAAMESKQKDMDIQFMRHQKGVSDYLGVADSRMEWLDAKWNHLGQQVVVLTRVVALYKSLGGGWNQAGKTTSPPVEKN